MTWYETLADEWQDHFRQKQADYGNAADDLGAPGQYAELHRKMGKLKKTLWHGEPLEGEQVDEVLLDMIGHCFLSLKYVRENDDFLRGKQ